MQLNMNSNIAGKKYVIKGKHMAEDVNFIPLQVLREISKTLQSEVILPNNVMSAEEAKQMTGNDKMWRVWNVGDEYYLLRNLGEDYEEICCDDQLWC